MAEASGKGAPSSEALSPYLEQAQKIAMKALEMDKISAVELPDYITTVAEALSKADRSLKDLAPAPGAAEAPTVEAPSTLRKQRSADNPAVPIEESVHDDFIVCLEDGERMKMLKRHLRVFYDMSPEEYREKWGLPADYPMVAPVYSRLRRNLLTQTANKSRVRAQQAEDAGKPPPKRTLVPGKLRDARRRRDEKEKPGEE